MAKQQILSVLVIADGGCKGNGRANAQAYGSYAVVYNGHVKKVEHFDLPDIKQTNNVAEWHALINAINYVVGLQSRLPNAVVHPIFAMDSEHVISIIKGEMNAKLLHIKQCKSKAEDALLPLGDVEIQFEKIDRDIVVEYLGH